MTSRCIGPQALVATLSVARQRKKNGPAWQYHPRSDHHSKVACLLMALDLMRESEYLRSGILSGKIACGINHVMTDFQTGRKKALDLVFHRWNPEEDSGPPVRTFRDLLKEYGVLAVLTPDQLKVVSDLPNVPVRDVAAHGVYIAFEAKAAMTEFDKARPRLFDELSSSYQAIHGDTEQAIAAGFVMINHASSFISPLRRKEGVDGEEYEVTPHKQPASFERVVAKMNELRRRASTREIGFDAVGIVAVECRNDGSPVLLCTAAETRKVIGDRGYDEMIKRVAHLFTAHFPNL